MKPNSYRYYIEEIAPDGRRFNAFTTTASCVEEVVEKLSPRREVSSVEISQLVDAREYKWQLNKNT